MYKSVSRLICCFTCAWGVLQSSEPCSVVRLSTNHDSILEYIEQWLPVDPIIVEAGGFDGSDSYRMASRWPNGQVHTFEPVPELYQKILLSAKLLKNANLHVYPQALADFNGTTAFYLSSYHPQGETISGSSSMRKPKEHLIYSPEIFFPKTITVPTITLDNWAQQYKIDHIDFLWLDMQGSELNMLKASQLAKEASAIWIEVEFIEAYENQFLFQDILDWMQANQFQLIATNFDRERPSMWFGDALFVRVP